MFHCFQKLVHHPIIQNLYFDEHQLLILYMVEKHDLLHRNFLQPKMIKKRVSNKILMIYKDLNYRMFFIDPRDQMLDINKV